jgi:hypothetical protein
VVRCGHGLPCEEGGEEVVAGVGKSGGGGGGGGGAKGEGAGGERCGGCGGGAMGVWHGCCHCGVGGCVYVYGGGDGDKVGNYIVSLALITCYIIQILTFGVRWCM